MGCGQGSLGTPIPRTPIVAPGPKARSDLAERRSQRASAERRGPQQPAALVAAWRLIGRGTLNESTNVGVKTGGSRVGGPELCVKVGW